MRLDGTARTSLTIGALGLSQSIPLVGQLSDGRLNGQSFVEAPLQASLAPENTLVLTCG